MLPHCSGREAELRLDKNQVQVVLLTFRSIQLEVLRCSGQLRGGGGGVFWGFFPPLQIYLLDSQGEIKKETWKNVCLSA